MDIKPNATVGTIDSSELGALLALYEHLHSADDPLPGSEVVECVWQELLGNPRYQYIGAYSEGRLVSAFTARAITPAIDTSSVNPHEQHRISCFHDIN